MARIRSIKVDLFVDDSLADVSLEAHFLLAGLPVLADRAGRLEDRPRRIQAQIFPYRPTIDVNACLEELEASGHVRRYVAGGQRYVEILNWERDQRPHVKESASTLPAPPHDYTEHRNSTDPAPASSRRVPGDNTCESAGIMDSGYGVLDLGSGNRDPVKPLRGQAELVGVVESAGVGKKRKAQPKAEEEAPTAGPVHQLRQQYAEAWAKAGREDRLLLPVKRSPEPRGDPVDYGREGQLWRQLLGLARMAGAEDDAKAVDLVLLRLGHAARLTKPQRDGNSWVEKLRVHSLADFVASFPDAAEDPRERRIQSSIHSTAVSDWSEERKKHGEAPRTPTDAEIVEAMERARKAGAR